jgi:hypothetical protein
MQFAIGAPGNVEDTSKPEAFNFSSLTIGILYIFSLYLFWILIISFSILILILSLI